MGGSVLESYPGLCQALSHPIHPTRPPTAQTITTSLGSLSTDRSRQPAFCRAKRRSSGTSPTLQRWRGMWRTTQNFSEVHVNQPRTLQRIR